MKHFPSFADKIDYDYLTDPEDFNEPEEIKRESNLENKDNKKKDMK